VVGGSSPSRPAGLLPCWFARYVPLSSGFLTRLSGIDFLMDKGTLSMPNEARSAGAIRSFLEDRLNQLRVDNQASFEILVASGEAVANACLHGTRRDRKGVIEVTCDRRSPTVVVTVSDDGPGFDPQGLDASPPHPLDNGRRGIFLMRELTDEVVIESNRRGTKVTLVRKLGRGIDRKAS
jgi:serine/threonine-protein kinase RsbW